MGATVKEEMNLAKKEFSNGEGQSMEDLDIEEQQLTVSKLRYMLPKDSKVNVNQSTVDTINKLIDDSGVHRGLMEERLMTYTHLLGPGVGMKQLLKAIQFVTLSMTPGMTQSKAYMVTFPDRAQKLLDRGADPSSHASEYASTKLPRTIQEGVQVGLSTTYAPLQHQLVEKLINLSNGKAAGGDKASATVQLNATLGLMELIKVNEDQTINVNATSKMDEESKQVQVGILEQLKGIAASQASNYKKGNSINEVQRLNFVIDSGESDD